MRNAWSILAQLSFTQATWGQATRARTMFARVVASLLLFGGVWSAAQAQEVTSSLTVNVPIQAFVFQPTTVSVPVGTTVFWTNMDPVDHTVTDVDQYWDSGLFGEGGVFAKTFDTPGTYVYYCIPHPIMIGTIEVTG